MNEQKRLTRAKQRGRTRWLIALSTIWLTSPIVFASYNNQRSILSPVVAQSPTPTPTLLQSAPATANPDSPRLLKIQIEISDPDDLKVRTGDTIEVGQILADQPAKRQKLLGELRQLEASLAKLEQPTIPLTAPRTVPPLPPLPPINYATEEATITNASLKVKEIENKIKIQERKLSIIEMMTNESGQGDLPPGALVHEQEVLTQLQGQLERARGEESLAIAKLETAKNQRAYSEYRHKLAIAKQIEEQNTARSNFQRQQQQQQAEERQREIQKAELRARINEIKLLIEQNATIKSNYAGRIRRIRFGRQNNNSLSVELFMSVSAPISTTTTTTDTPSQPQSTTPTFSDPTVPDNTSADPE